MIMDQGSGIKDQAHNNCNGDFYALCKWSRISSFELVLRFFLDDNKPGASIVKESFEKTDKTVATSNFKNFLTYCHYSPLSSSLWSQIVYHGRLVFALHNLPSFGIWAEKVGISGMYFVFSFLLGSNDKSGQMFNSYKSSKNWEKRHSLNSSRTKMPSLWVKHLRMCSSRTKNWGESCLIFLWS